MWVIQWLILLVHSTLILQRQDEYEDPTRGELVNKLEFPNQQTKRNSNHTVLRTNNGSSLNDSDDDFIIEDLKYNLNEMTRGVENINVLIKGSHNAEDLVHIDEEIGELYESYQICYHDVYKLNEWNLLSWRKEVDKFRPRITSLQISLSNRLQLLEEDVQKENYELVIRLIRDSRIYTALATFRTLNYPYIAITGIVTKAFKKEVDNCKLILAFAEKLTKWRLKSYILANLYEALATSTDLTSDAGSECAFKITWLAAQWIKSVPEADTKSIACLFDLLSGVAPPFRYFAYATHVTIRKSAERCQFATSAAEREFRRNYVGDLNFFQPQSSKYLGNGEYFILIDEMTKNVLESYGDKPYLAHKWKGWDSQQWKPTLDSKGKILLRHKSSGKYLHFNTIDTCYEYSMSNAPETHWFVKK